MSQQLVEKEWKNVKSVDDAMQVIDYGVLLGWQEMRQLKKSIPDDESDRIIRHFVLRLIERKDDRLASEIIVESLLIWLTQNLSEPLVIALFEELLKADDPEVIQVFIEIAITNEVAETEHGQNVFSVAIGLICELGVAICQYTHVYKGHLKNGVVMLDHLTTYLLSVSNSNDNKIRLSLLHFFGFTSRYRIDKSAFNRIMGRFGHTVLDHLFALLFNKRSEAISLQYLMENLPYILEADSSVQRITHETFKYYMLKKPERFSLFVQTFAEQLLLSEARSDENVKSFLQHLGALFSVVSEVNHKALGRELVIAIDHFRGIAERDQLFEQLLNEVRIRQVFKQLIKAVCECETASVAIESVVQFRSSKRGRKPSFSRVEGLGTLDQVSFLGSFELVKAS